MKKAIASLVIAVAAAIQAQAGTFLCIGLDRVEGYPVLNHAESDATRMAGKLMKAGHTVTLLTGSEVTRAAVVAAMKDPETVVYFAGHGEKEHVLLSDGVLDVAEMAGYVSDLLLDCCYVGGSLQGEGSTRVLAAAQHEAFEGDGQGLFSKYLISWMESGKRLSDAGLADHVRSGIMRETGGWQKPVLGFI